MIEAKECENELKKKRKIKEIHISGANINAEIINKIKITKCCKKMKKKEILSQ